jgi:hypothetical protein
MVNLLLSLVGILPALYKKGAATNRPVDSAADQSPIEQLPELVRKG